MSKILVWFIRAYQYLASPFLGANCRFHPTCSDYACQAVHAHGPLHGLWLAMRRIGRCNPWSAGGHDPVPPKIDSQN